MMSRTLLSRPNLEKAIEMAGIDTQSTSPAGRGQIVGRVAQNVSIKSTGKENIYTMSYTGQDPQEAKRIVQSLVTMFVKDSQGDQRKDSEEAQRFIDEQLKSYGEKLAVAEKEVMDFKRLNAGLMPSEGGNFYARLDGAETALRQATLDLREAENSRDAIRQQLANYRNLDSLLRSGKVEGLKPELDARIDELEKRLDGLLVTYTNQHPDVLALKRLIAHLKDQRAVEVAKIRAAPSAPRPLDLGHQQLLISLSAAEASVAAMRARVSERARRLDELKATASALPRVEADYTRLTRDYEVLKTRYNSLRDRREAAKISSDMDETPTVMGFRVVDPPRLPVVPIKPDRLRLVSLVLLMALAGGLGVAFVLGQLRPTFHSENNLQEVTGLPILGTVWMEWTGAQKARRTGGVVAVLISFASLLSAYAAIMVSLIFVGSRV
jgi:polysaccharide chain length determinant protein (PEP-CTERM system associated)